MNTKLITLLLIAVTLTSCNTTKNAKEEMSETTTSIKDASWQLISLEREKVKPLKSEKIIKLTFDGEKGVNGFSGCNNFMGSYKLSENQKIEFAPMASTRKACPDESFDENAFLQMFSKVESYKIEGHKLTLMNRKGKALATFNKLDNDSEITEKHWRLVSANGEKVDMGENQERERYLIFREKDHQITGYAGCNNFTGTYAFKENQKIELSKMASTLRACSDPKSSDAILLKVLKKTDNYTYSQDQLQLRDKDNKVLGTFKAIYF